MEGIWRDVLAIKLIHFIDNKTEIKKGELTGPTTHVRGNERKPGQKVKGVKKKEGMSCILNSQKPLICIPCWPPCHQASWQDQRFKSKPLNRQAWWGPHLSPWSGLLPGVSTPVYSPPPAHFSGESTRSSCLVNDAPCAQFSGPFSWRCSTGVCVPGLQWGQAGGGTLQWRASLHFERDLL